MKLYKLTDENDCTRNNTQWGEGIEHTASGEGELCSSGFLHAYEHPLVAVFMNPIHAGFVSPHLWLADGDVAKRDGQLKCGCTRLKTIKRLELPTITIEQRVEVAIRCAKLVCDDKSWNEWADAWISGKDRTAEAAEAAAVPGSAVPGSAAVGWAVRSARSARSAARSAAWAARSAAAWAARMTEVATTEFDLIAILEEVC